MQFLQIGDCRLPVKDYECSENGVYPEKTRLQLWLYLELNDACPANCPFCVYRAGQGRSVPGGKLDPRRLEQILTEIRPFVRGVSLTGGEPMLEPGHVEQIVRVIRDTLPPEIELDLVTNGVNLARLPTLEGLSRFATVHISRHAADDAQNRGLFGWDGAPSLDALRAVLADLPDRGASVLNCLLQRQGVCDQCSALAYLETAAALGAACVSFIGMFPANDFCRRNAVSPHVLDLAHAPGVTVWNHFRDHGFCECSAGDYLAEAGYVRYYYRCPGPDPAPAYCRQLVIDPAGRLKTGFGAAPEIALHPRRKIVSGNAPVETHP